MYAGSRTHKIPIIMSTAPTATLETAIEAASEHAGADADEDKHHDCKDEAKVPQMETVVRRRRGDRV